MSTSTDQEPILERFTLRGVHGYKDISIDFNGAATIIVAENGTGKTTVLSALNAFLSRRFHRLAALSFDRLECKFVGVAQIVSIDRETLGPATEGLTDALRAVSRAAAVSEDELLDFIQLEYSPETFDRMRGHAIISQLYINNPGNYDQTKRVLDDLYSLYSSSLSNSAKGISDNLRGILDGTDIVYLPTFRRIERPLLRVSKTRESPRPGFLKATDKREYTYEGIAFGLGDIEARLTELTAEIERTSNFGYRGQSAQILDELLQGKPARASTDPSELPDIGSLSLFLGRLGRTERNLNRVFRNINDLYESGRIYAEEYDVLRYFLARLNVVISDTKFLEQKIEQFVNVCNSYLTMSSDEKQLAFDPLTLKVVVQNTWANCTVPLDALSSGEKQIVSLMAKLYLYEKSKIVLIDEPELSLSLDWQRKVLPDVLSSGSVTQLLAITHSPFVFDNELDRFAGSLQVTKSLRPRK